ncbi:MULTISPECIES: DUF7224 domain-containing protein [unclassified Nocardioides]|uniref:DUF7224 domain-containing protein n=1 Tax=unclassified Nocardioides TaxID=2615069 RepID=UPI0006FE54EF|nr:MULTISPECIES: hypothetical protein [unclassified Nocardioides]KRA38346.1 hypothetical protein ASD81_06825 [Nocardioides sp. Root614]KRA92305.1 hypothetical protein ASD84_07090 [Nocardioides sp. Root682]
MKVWLAWLGERRAIAVQFVLLLAAGLVWIGGRFPDLMGSWKQSLDFCAGATSFMGPIAAGTSCLAYARLRRSAMGEILLQSSRDWLRWLQPGLAIWGIAVAALLTLTLAMTTVASLAGVPAYWEFVWILVPSVLMLSAHTAIGAAIGFSSGRAWLAPLVVVLVYLLFLLTAVGVLPHVFDTGGVTGNLGGQGFATWPILTPGIVALGIAACALAAGSPRIFLSTWPRRLLLAVAVAAWGTGWFLAPGDSDLRYTLVADPPLTCAGSSPQVCVYEETPRPLKDLSERMHRQARSLVALDVPLPDRFAQSVPGRETRPEGGVVLMDRASRSTVTDDLATASLLRPSSSCPADSGPEPPYLAFEVRHQLGRWLQVQAGILRPDPGRRDYAWLTSDLQVQAPWVRTTYRQLTECAFDQLRLPDGLG